MVGALELEDFKVASTNPDFKKLLAENPEIQSAIKSTYGEEGSKFVDELTPKKTSQVSANRNNQKTLAQGIPNLHPDTKKIYRQATDITEFEGSLFERTLKVIPDQNLALQEAKASPQSGFQFEASTAELLRQNKIAYKQSTLYVNKRTGDTRGEVDFRAELPNSKKTVVVETTTNDNGKYDQIINKYVPDIGIVKTKEPIILYAPNYPEDAANQILRDGNYGLPTDSPRVYWVKTEEEFLALLKKLDK